MRRLNLPLLLAAALGLGACVPDQLGQLGKPSITNTNIRLGQPAYVACTNLPVHAQPTGFSPVVGVARFGLQVQPLDYEGIYELPASQQDKTVSAGDTSISANMKSMGAGWAKVQMGGTMGYLAQSCLVDRALMERQDPKGRQRAAPTQVSRGFSEDERGDQRVAKGGLGAAGAARGPANYDAADRLIQGTPVGNPYVDDAAFRQEGRLGEFK